MPNDFMSTVKHLPANSQVKAKQEKTDIFKHIFSKQSSLQNQLNVLDRHKEQQASCVSDPMPVNDHRPEWRDPAYLRATLCEYIRLGHVLCSTDAAFVLRGVSVLDVNLLIKNLKKSVQIYKSSRQPKITIKNEIPRFYREGTKVTPLIEMLFQTLTAYRPEENAEFSIEARDAKSQIESLSSELVIEVTGAKTSPGMTVERFEEIQKELRDGDFANWKLLGTRLVACILSCNHLGCQLKPQAVSGELLTFQAIIPMGRFHEKVQSQAIHGEALVEEPIFAI